MLNQTVYKIEETGEDFEGKFMYKHMILTTEQYQDILNNNIRIDELAVNIQVDFISVLRNDKINFMHTTSPSNKEFILNNGLKIKYDEFFDLGLGIYAIKKDSLQGLENLKTFVAEGYEDEEILIITGYYTGSYTECIYGSNHEGYIVLFDNVDSKNITNFNIMLVDDFLFM